MQNEAEDCLHETFWKHVYKKSIFLLAIQTSISDLVSSSSETSLKLQQTEDKGKHKIKHNAAAHVQHTAYFTDFLLYFWVGRWVSGPARVSS